MNETRHPKAVYRAHFTGRIPRGHELQIKLDCTVEVEVYPVNATRWRARILPTKARLDVTGASAEQVQREVAELYTTQVSPWERFDVESPVPRRRASPRVTHLMNDDPLPKQDHVKAACGKIVRRKQIVRGVSDLLCAQCLIIAEKGGEPECPPWNLEE